MISNPPAPYKKNKKRRFWRSLPWNNPIKVSKGKKNNSRQLRFIMRIPINVFEQQKQKGKILTIKHLIRDNPNWEKKKYTYHFVKNFITKKRLSQPKEDQKKAFFRKPKCEKKKKFTFNWEKEEQKNRLMKAWFCWTVSRWTLGETETGGYNEQIFPYTRILLSYLSYLDFLLMTAFQLLISCCCLDE